MKSSGFFHQPLSFYHGRIPFIIVDLIGRLKDLQAETSKDIFNEDNVGNNLEQLIQALNEKKLKSSAWTNYKNVATISIALVRYLNCITCDEPLFSNECKDALVEENLSLKSSNYAHVFRKNMVSLYPGNYRTILIVTDFLRNIETTSMDAMFEKFGPSFFGKNAIQRSRNQFRILFILLLIHHREIFNGAILGQAAHLTPQQVSVLEKRVENWNSSSSTSSAAEEDLRTPKNAVAPHTPRSPKNVNSSPTKKAPKNNFSAKKQTKANNDNRIGNSNNSSGSKASSAKTEDPRASLREAQRRQNDLQDQQLLSESEYDSNYSDADSDSSNSILESDENQEKPAKDDTEEQKNQKKLSPKNSLKKPSPQKPEEVIAERSVKLNLNSSHDSNHSNSSNNDQPQKLGISIPQEFVASVVADIKPEMKLCEVSVQAACLNKTAVKTIFEFKGDKIQQRNISISPSSNSEETALSTLDTSTSFLEDALKVIETKEHNFQSESSSSSFSIDEEEEILSSDTESEEIPKIKQKITQKPPIIPKNNVINQDHFSDDSS